MCKASNEPGGPQRCSGHTRAKFEGSIRNVATLEEQQDELLRRAIAEMVVPERPARKSLTWDEWSAQARAAGLDEESLAGYRKRYEAGKSDLV